jgi:hypothetical protein
MKRKGFGLLREVREDLPPVSQGGTEAKAIRSTGHNGHVSAREFPEGLPRPDEFTLSTVILNDGDAVWELPTPSCIRGRSCRLVDATLRIETVRTHGMLHSPVPGASAGVFVNDYLVDEISLVKPHPHGEDFGVDSRRPFPIFRYFDIERDVQTIRIEVDAEASWDIDSVSIEPVVIRREITPGASMIIGAAISAALGALVTYLAQ